MKKILTFGTIKCQALDTITRTRWLSQNAIRIVNNLFTQPAPKRRTN